MMGSVRLVRDFMSYMGKTSVLLGVLMVMLVEALGFHLLLALCVLTLTLL